MTNIKLLSLSILSALVSLSMTAQAADDASATAAADGEKTYKAACFVCHDTAVANAPKLGDKVAWAPRIATGKEALYTTSIQGKGAMPPKGGRTDLSDDAVKAAVDYMVSKVEDDAAEKEAPKTEETKDAPKEEPKKEETPKAAKATETEPKKEETK